MRKLQQLKGITQLLSTENTVAGLNLGGLHETLSTIIGSWYIQQVTTLTVTSPQAKDFPSTNKDQKTTTTPQ
jgi:hypothetical protein